MITPAVFYILTAYQDFRANIKDKTYLSWLQIEELFHSGMALSLNFDEQIATLRGLKLLSLLQYKPELIDEQMPLHNE